MLGEVKDAWCMLIVSYPGGRGRGIARAIDRTKGCQLQPGLSLGLACLTHPGSEHFVVYLFIFNLYHIKILL